VREVRLERLALLRRLALDERRADDDISERQRLAVGQRPVDLRGKRQHVRRPGPAAIALVELSRFGLADDPDRDLAGPAGADRCAGPSPDHSGLRKPRRSDRALHENAEGGAAHSLRSRRPYVRSSSCAYAATFTGLCGWLTTSLKSKWSNAVPGTPRSTRGACFRPDSRPG